jgi:hypothetical protein
MVQIIEDYATLQHAEMLYLIEQYPVASDHLRGLLDGQSQRLHLVERLARLGEIIYANRGEVTDSGKVLCAQIAYINAIPGGGSFGYGADNRGMRIRSAMERDLGEIDGPDPATDPAPRAEYAEPAPEPEDPPA